MSEERKIEPGMVLRATTDRSRNSVFMRGDAMIVHSRQSDTLVYVWTPAGVLQSVSIADTWDTGVVVEVPRVAVGWRVARPDGVLDVLTRGADDEWHGQHSYGNMRQTLIWKQVRCLEYSPPDLAAVLAAAPPLPDTLPAPAADPVPDGEPPTGALVEVTQDFDDPKARRGERCVYVRRNRMLYLRRRDGRETSHGDVLMRHMGRVVKVLAIKDYCTVCLCRYGEWGEGTGGLCKEHRCKCPEHMYRPGAPAPAAPDPAAAHVTATPLATSEHLPLQVGDVLRDPSNPEIDQLITAVHSEDDVRSECPGDTDYEGTDDEVNGQEWLATEWPQLIARSGLTYRLTGGDRTAEDPTRGISASWHLALVKVVGAEVREDASDEDKVHVAVKKEGRGGTVWWPIDRFVALTGPGEEKAAGEAPAEAVAETNDKEQAMPTQTKEQLEADSKFKDVAVMRADTAQITIPNGMSKSKAAEWLLKADREDQKSIAFSHEIEAYPLEGAYALFRALTDRFGFVSLEKTPGFFGDNPPTMVGLDVAIDRRVNVPWGRLAISGIAGYMETHALPKPSGQILFVLSGETTRRDEEKINEIVALVREYVTRGSIYKGHAVKVNFPKKDDGWDFSYTPKFMDTRDTRVGDLIFPQEVQDLIEVSLFAPIERTAVCRALKIPLKRGILLEGPFGVGKTLTASVTAKKCSENGWTFMYLEKVADLKKAVALARQYQPCVIFAEDVDRVVEGERNVEMDEILNTIDGIDGKTNEVIVVLTTNNVDKINRAMLRPGRLDAVIPVRPPDAVAAERLVRLYARGLIREGEDLTSVGLSLAGQIPAVIREAVERAKLGAVVHLAADADRVELTSRDLVVASNSMLTQLELMKTPPQDKRSDREKAADILRRGFLQASGMIPVEPKAQTTFASGNGSHAIEPEEAQAPRAEG